MTKFHRDRIVATGALVALMFVIYSALPQSLFRAPCSTVVLARDGRLLGAKIAADGQWRFPPLIECPPRFAAAALAYEDRRFYHHPGVDPLAVLRAAWQNAKTGKTVSGASTISMQVIRLSRRGRPRTVAEKLREAFLSLRLELFHRKRTILALYASHAPFGGNVVGLSAAAWRYFGRDPENLSWGEAALLAVLPNSPSLMRPGRNRERLREKRDRLLERLRREGGIDSVTCALARLEPIPEQPLALPRSAPHLTQRLARGLGHPDGFGRGSLWRTSLDADLQARAVEVLARRRRDLEGKGVRNGAVLVLRASTGEVLAYVGNMPDTGMAGDGRQVDIVTSPRSTGSLLKPFLYAAMLEAGEILPSTLIPDVPMQVGGYAPENFDRGYEGAVPARMALARSLNVPAVRMLKEYGVERFRHLLRGLGMTTLDRSADSYGLTLVLGGAEGTLWDLCGLYAGLAREAEERSGFFPPRLFDDAHAADPPAGKGLALIGPAAAWLTLQAMVDVSRPDAEKYWRSFASSRWVAWKTGTSFGFRDAWAMGVTPEYVVGVWIGNADGQGRPGMTGIEVAAPVLFETFNLLPPTTPGFPKPAAALVSIPVCRESGMRPSSFCPTLDTAWVPMSGLRTDGCPYHRVVHLDPSGSWQVHDGCQSIAHMRHEPWFVLPPTQEWYYRQHHSGYLPLPPWRKDCAEGALTLGKPRSMELIYPRGSAKIYVPVDLDARKSRTVFEAVHRDPGATVFWHLDHDYLGLTREFHKWAIDPAPGAHSLLLVDNRGERLEHRFEVLSRDSVKVP